MNDLWLDIRFGLRGLRRQPVFAAIVILTLALGIGVSSAIFTLVDAALLRPLGYEHEERLVSIGSVWSGGFEHSSVSIPEYLDYRDRVRSFDAIAAYRQTSVNMTSGRGEPENLQAALVTAGFLDVLGVPMTKGRTFKASEDAPGGERVVILSNRLWERRFDTDEDVIGRAIGIDGESYRVIGIMPRFVQYPTEVELWTTLQINESEPGNRGAHNRHAIARLAPDVSLDQAQREMTAFASVLQEEHPQNYPEASGWGISLLPLREILIGDVQKPLVILMVAVAVLLLIAGSNVANLMLAQMSRRREEMATRAALGARGSRLVRQILTESLLLGALGGIAGIWVATLVAPALLTIAPESIHHLGNVGVDWRVILFTFCTSIAVASFFGLITSWTIPSQIAGREFLSGTRTTRSSGTKQVLIVAEVALAFLLLIGAGLLVRTFVNLVSTDPGLDVNDVTTARISLSRDRYPDNESRTRFFERLLDHLEARPEVEVAGAVSILPLGGSDTDFGFGVEGWVPPTPDFEPFEQARVVTPGYFQALRVPLLRGRTFETTDTPDSPPVVVVSESFARTYWPGSEALGKRIKLWGLDAEGQPWRTVTGVVGDIRHYGLGEDAPPILYFPLTQLGQRSMSVVARGRVSDLSPAIVGEETRTIDPEQAVYSSAMMEDVVGESLSGPRLNLVLLGMFAGLALLLSAIGIYGVLSFLVGQRTREIGIRLALGASPPAILLGVLRRGMVLVVLGVVIGAIASAGLTRSLQSLLYGVSATDPTTYVVITALVFAIALIACLRPAMRATRIEPSEALRQL